MCELSNFVWWLQRDVLHSNIIDLDSDVIFSLAEYYQGRFATYASPLTDTQHIAQRSAT